MHEIMMRLSLIELKENYKSSHTNEDMFLIINITVYNEQRRSHHSYSKRDKEWLP